MMRFAQEHIENYEWILGSLRLADRATLQILSKVGRTTLYLGSGEGKCEETRRGRQDTIEEWTDVASTKSTSNKANLAGPRLLWLMSVACAMPVELDIVAI